MKKALLLLMVLAVISGAVYLTASPILSASAHVYNDTSSGHWAITAGDIKYILSTRASSLEEKPEGLAYTVVGVSLRNIISDAGLLGITDVYDGYGWVIQPEKRTREGYQSTKYNCIYYQTYAGTESHLYSFALVPCKNWTTGAGGVVTAYLIDWYVLINELNSDTTVKKSIYKSKITTSTFPTQNALNAYMDTTASFTFLYSYSARKWYIRSALFNWDMPTSITLGYTPSTTTIEGYIKIPTTMQDFSAQADGTGIYLGIDYMEYPVRYALLNSSNAFVDNYNAGYNDGYEAGEIAGYDEGYATGEATGFATAMQPRSWASSILDTVGDILSLEIFPNFKLGYIIGIPLIISLVSFVFGLATGRKGE